MATAFISSLISFVSLSIITLLLYILHYIPIIFLQSLDVECFNFKNHYLQIKGFFYCYYINYNYKNVFMHYQYLLYVFKFQIICYYFQNINIIFLNFTLIFQYIMSFYIINRNGQCQLKFIIILYVSKKFQYNKHFEPIK